MADKPPNDEEQQTDKTVADVIEDMRRMAGEIEKSADALTDLLVKRNH